MTGLSIFLLGTVALTNVALIAYLFGNRNKSVKPPDSASPRLKNSETTQQSNESLPVNKVENNARVGASNFDVDEFLRKFNQLEQGVYKINETLERLEGEVKLKDVEFANSEDAPTSEEIEKDSNVVDNSAGHMKDARLSKEEESKAFEDLRIDEFDSDIVSAPSATGASIDEIENDVNTALNEKAPSRDRVRASEKLLSLLDTNLFDALASNEKVLKGLQSYIRQAMKNDMSDKQDSKVVIKTQSESSKKTIPPQKAFGVSKKIDEFNPADLIRK